MSNPRTLGRYMLWWMGVLFAQAAPAQALSGLPDAVTGYDPREVRLLPPFCPYTQDFRAHIPGGGNRDEIDKWKSVLGPTYEHMHHYCWGLMKMNRAVLFIRGEKELKVSYLADSNKEFDYVIERAPIDFILLPEIVTKKAENLVRLGRGPAAIVEFSRAIDMKPDYWPPYAHMSDYYRQVGDKAKAREVLEQGLARAPDSDPLKRRLAELSTGNGQRSKE